MSIIGLDGFDLYDASTDNELNPVVRAGLWNGMNNPQLATYESRNNGNAITANVSVNINSFGIGPQSKHMILGLAYRVNLEPSDVGSVIITLPRVEGDNALVIDLIPPINKQNPWYRIRYNIRSAGAVEFGGELVRGIWNYMEIEINANLGTVKIWINGTLLVDTTIATDTTMQDLNLGLFPMSIDDLYWLNGEDASQGAQFQARLGPVQIRPIPLSSDQVPSEFLSLGGGDKYLEVDEQPGANDKDASYIYAQQAPQTQMFGVTAYDSLLPILAVTALAVVKQSDPDSGVAKMSFVADDGTVVENAMPTPLQSVYRMFSQDYVTMPGGGALDVASIEAAKWGVKIYPDNT